MRQSTRLRLDNGRGHPLAAILESPSQPTAYAIFSHCFTCTKDLKAIVRISRRLTKSGIAVLRFDFTGLGESEGDFSATNFADNCADIVAVSEFLGNDFQPPKLLIGHSLGGAAALAVARSIPSVKAIATIAAPSETQHLAAHLSQLNPAIEREGQGTVTIGGTPHTITSQMIDCLREFDLPKRIRQLDRPLLIFHSPVDETLAWEHAQRLFQLAPGPCAFVTLDGSDHLLVRRADDVDFVADMIGLWAARYFD